VTGRKHGWARGATVVVVVMTAISLSFAFGAPGAAVVFSLTVLVTALAGNALGSALVRSRHVADVQSREIAIQRRFEHVAALAPAVICTLAPARSGWPALTYAGPGLDALLGESKGPLVFRADLLAARVDVRDITVVHRSFGLAVSESGPWQQEFRIIHPHAGLRWIAASAAYDGSSAFGSRWHAVLEDATHRHAVQAPMECETVLVCDDEPGIRVLLERVLADEGYRVFAAGHPLEALGLAEEQRVRIDLLVSDVVMPGMLGPELAEALRARNTGLPVLFVSAHPRHAIRSRVALPPGCGFLEKPFAVSDLLLEVRRLLSRDAA
jgi:CheY-like chemotaxis protein